MTHNQLVQTSASSLLSLAAETGGVPLVRHLLSISIENWKEAIRNHFLRDYRPDRVVTVDKRGTVVDCR